MSEWIAYASIEPFGERPAYQRAGIIAATIANVYRKKEAKPFTEKDFMPPEPTIKKKQTVEEMKEIFRNIVAWGKMQGKKRQKK